MWSRVSMGVARIILFLTLLATLFILSIQIRYLPENTYLEIIAEHHRVGLYLILGAVTLWILMKVCRMIQDVPEKYNKTVVASFLGIIFAVQMIYIFSLKPGLYADPFTLAYTAKAGLQSSLGYYMVYPMQITMTMIIRIWYKIAAFFGISDLIMAGAVLASVCMDISLYFAYKVVENIISDPRKARVLFVLAALNPSVYLWGSYLYTHVVSVMFMTAAIYFILLLKDAEKKKDVVFYTGIVIVLSYCGMCIRSNGIFAILALAVCCMLDICWLWKNKISIIYYIVPSLIALSIAVGGMHMAESYYMKKEGVTQFDASETKMPMAYWFLIGASAGTGFPYFSYIADLPTQEQKVEKAVQKIAEFVSERDFKETVDWIEDQWCHVFGIGHTFGWYQLNIYRNNIGHVRSHLTVDRGAGLWIYSQVLLVILFIFLCTCLIHELFYCKNCISKTFFVSVIFAGAVVYQAIGETQPSYQMAWITVLFILAVVGYVWWCECMKLIKDRLRFVRTDKLHKSLLGLFLVMFIMTAGYMCYFFSAFTKTDVMETNYVVSVTERDGELAGDMIAQSFEAKQPFNHVSLDIVPHVTDSEKPLQYELALLDVQKDIIASQVFDIHQLTEGKLDMAFTTVYPKEEGIYYLSCRQVNADMNNYISVNTFDETIFDLNESGTLCVDGAERRCDAKFSVYEVLSSPYESEMEYVLSFGLVLVLELCMFWDFRRLFVPEQKKERYPIGGS